MTTAADTSYEDLMEGLAAAYHDRAIALLVRVRDAARALGMYATDPFDMHDDDYRWTLGVWRTPYRGDDAEGVDVTLEIAEERAYDDEDGHGVNFGLMAVEYGGLIICGFQPHNFTPSVWVDALDPEATLERWRELEGCHVETIAERIKES
jgi:hypothetical protein